MLTRKKCFLEKGKNKTKNLKQRKDRNHIVPYFYATNMMYCTTHKHKHTHTQTHIQLTVSTVHKHTGTLSISSERKITLSRSVRDFLYKKRISKGFLGKQ